MDVCLVLRASAEDGSLLIRFAILLFQEPAADQHGGGAARFPIWPFPLDREETLDGVVEVGTVLLPVAVLVAPLPIQLVGRRSAYLIDCTLGSGDYSFTAWPLLHCRVLLLRILCAKVGSIVCAISFVRESCPSFPISRTSSPCFVVRGINICASTKQSEDMVYLAVYLTLCLTGFHDGL